MSRLFGNIGLRCSWCPGKIPPRAMFLSQIWGTIIGELPKSTVSMLGV